MIYRKETQQEMNWIEWMGSEWMGSGLQKIEMSRMVFLILFCPKSRPNAV